MFEEETEMFAGRTEESKEGMTVVRETWLEIRLAKLVRMLKRVELEAEPDGRHCSGQSSSR